MKRFEIKCCMDSKSTDNFTMAELSAFAMMDGLSLLGVPEDQLYVDLIDHKNKVFKHIKGLSYSDIVLTGWQIYDSHNK